MSSKKVDLKQYQGKDRIYLPVAGGKGIVRLHLWDPEKGEYKAPTEAKGYLARRWDFEGDGKRARKTKYFASYREAIAWKERTEAATPKEVTGPVFAEVLGQWRQRRYLSFSKTTCVNYDKLIRLHFVPLLNVPMQTFTSQVVDDWIDKLIAGRNRYGRAATRKSFKMELKLLTTVLNYYIEYAEDLTFVMPIKKRHKDAVKLRNRSNTSTKDLSPSEFALFLTHLKLGADGDLMWVLAQLQYHDALRISEVVALSWEDVRFNWIQPRLSRLIFSKHVCYTHSSKTPDYIEAGFKNSDSVGGVKEHPMLPTVFEVLSKLYQPGAKGLIFVSPKRQQFFKYREIQARFNRAFVLAGLPYRSTHILRHGGTRKTFDETKGDMGVAQQQLGNRDRKTVEVYAQRSASAFTSYAADQWDQYDGLGGRKWSQTADPVPTLQ